MKNCENEIDKIKQLMVYKALLYLVRCLSFNFFL